MTLLFLGIFLFHLIFLSLSQSVTLSSNPQVTLSYSFPQSDTIRFTMISYTQGYVGIGFGTQMSGTNMIMAYKSNGNFIVKDTTGYGQLTPVDQTNQNVNLVSGSRDTEKTTVVFDRLLSTGDSSDYVIPLSQNIPVIWAVGPSDSMVKHTRDGVVYITFEKPTLTCDSSCNTCSVVATNCTSCNAGMYLQANGTCTTCDASCSNCSGPTNSQCLSCQGSYFYNNGACEPCDASCANCSGPSYLECLSCPSNHFLNLDGGCALNYTTCTAINGSSCFTMQLKSNPTINIFYAFPNSSHIIVGMEYSTQGYIAFGFGFNMSQADIMLANMTNQQFTLTEGTSWQQTEPVIDSQQCSELLQGSRTTVETTVIFTRELNPNATNKTLITPFTTQPVIFAYGDSDAIAYHGANRGQEFITFVTCDSSCATCYGPTNTDCLSCPTNFSFNSNQCLSTNGSNGSASVCPDNCNSCNGDTCLICQTNYTLQNGSCVTTSQAIVVQSIKIKDSPLIFLNYSFPSSNVIEFSMEFHTLGYISIGFGTSMADSDMVVSENVNGNLVVKSMTCIGHGTPTENAAQNLVTVSSSRDTEKTIITFRRNLTSSRLLATGDSLYSITLNTDTPLIWAYGQTDSFIEHVDDGELTAQFQQTNATCDTSCLTCSGSGTTQCLSCASGLTLSQGACIQQSSTTVVANILSDLTSYTKITDQIYLHWKFNANNTITMAFRWSTGGYIALGFGETMDGMDVISAEIVNSGLQVYDRWSSGDFAPPEDDSIGGKDDLTMLEFLSKDSQGFAVVKFIRALDTADKYDYVIKQQAVSFSIVDTDSPTMDYHGSNILYFKFDFVEGATADAIVEGSGKSDLIKAHGIGLLIAWGFLVDVALIVVRYFKHLKNYIDIHATIFFAIDVFTLIVVLVVTIKNRDSFEWKFENDQVITSHFALGVIILILVVFQHFLGYCMKKAMEAKNFNKLSSNLPSLKLIHRILGYSIYLISKATVLTGIWVYDDRKLFIGICIYFGILAIIRAGMELFYQEYIRKKKFSEIIAPHSAKLPFEELIKDLENHELPISKIVAKYPKLQWCMLNNSVYDLSKFNHPGGQFIIQQIKGREIGRFFFGAYSLEYSDFKPYTHTKLAKQLLDQRHVGDLQKEDINILQLLPTKKISTIWSLDDKRKLSSNVSMFDFSCPSYLVKNHIRGVTWFGRHFTISCPDSPNSKVRLYTTVLSLNESNTTLRNEIITFFSQKVGKSFHTQISHNFNHTAKQEDAKPVTIRQADSTSQTLSLVIKKYDTHDSFSSFIHDSQEEKNFEIYGPHGFGLELTRKSNGIHVIFCGGTGILPFVDLLDFLLFKSIYHVLLMNFGKEVAEQMNVWNEDYEEAFRPKFKVVLHAAFQTKEELEYLDFILTLFKINTTYNLGFFDMILRVNDGSKFDGIPTTMGYFDDQFFNQYVVPDQCSKIFVCGNPKMNKLIPEICLRNQIEKDKICLV